MMQRVREYFERGKLCKTTVGKLLVISVICCYCLAVDWSPWVPVSPVSPGPAQVHDTDQVTAPICLHHEQTLAVATFKHGKNNI